MSIMHYRVGHCRLNYWSPSMTPAEGVSEEDCDLRSPTLYLTSSDKLLLNRMYQCDQNKVDGNWGSWGSWSSCDSETGMMRRTRVCDNQAPLNGGAPCSGFSSEESKCSVDGNWGSWGSWSSCDSNTGMMRRTRVCDNPAPLNGGASCSGFSSEESKCSVDGNWGSWGSWSSCDSDTGMMRRT